MAALPKNQQSIRLFKNPVLEALTHVHPLIPLFMWSPVAVLLVALAVREGLWGPGIALAVASGGLIWTLTEYVLHRFVFHFKPRSAWQERIAYLIHGIHHDQPQDATRLVMPPAAALVLAVVLYLGFRLLLGVHWVMPFFSGFLVGYLCYDYIHYAIHHFMPRNAALKYLKNHHMKHHYMMHGARWGVSSALWDKVFGTMEERIPVPAPTASREASGGAVRGA